MDYWGSIAEWVAASASIGALAAAIVAAVIAKKLHGIESGRDEARAWRDKTAQAVKVAAWSCAEIEPGTSNPRSYGMVIKNASDSVIFDVSVESSGKGPFSNMPPMQLHVVPPGEYFVEHDPKSQYRWRFARAITESANEIRPVTKSPDIVVRSLQFRDSANNRWRRDESGALSPA